MGYYDCSARDAAYAAYEAAKAEYEQAVEEYNNAVELQESLDKEQQNVQSKMDQYDAIYNEVAAAGATFLTSQNVGYLQSGFNCLSDYSAQVAEAQAKCASEVSRCLDNKNQKNAVMQATYAEYCATPCVWVDDEDD